MMFHHCIFQTHNTVPTILKSVYASQRAIVRFGNGTVRVFVCSMTCAGTGVRHQHVLYARCYDNKLA